MVALLFLVQFLFASCLIFILFSFILISQSAWQIIIIIFFDETQTSSFNIFLFLPYFIVFLSTELQALQILQFKQCKGSHLAKNDEVHQEIQMICEVLGVPKSSASSDFYSLPVSLNNIESKV